MPLEEIIKGISLFDEDVEVIWGLLVENFSEEYFLPLIGKKYG